MNNIAIPDQPDSYKQLAEEVLETLNACIHWFRIPTNPQHREAMVRRWASAIRDMNLNRELAHKATQRYLDKRWARDPIPEPRDVFTISDATLKEWGVLDNNARSLRRYLTITKNWGWQEAKKHLPSLPFGKDVTRAFERYTWPSAAHEEGKLTQEICDTLRAIGEPELADLNEAILPDLEKRERYLAEMAKIREQNRKKLHEQQQQQKGQYLV